MSKQKESIWVNIFGVSFCIAVLYVVIACAVFEFRNPLANRMAVFRDFTDVMQFNKLDKYQYDE